MNGTPYHISVINRLMKWPVICGLSALLLVQTASAGLDFYINDSVVPNAPIIDATNFVNNNSFTTVNYETTDTLNYTNYGTMFGEEGFLFDTLTLGSPGGRSMASSFYNPGSITVPAITISNGRTIQTLGSPLVVNATNIVSPGTLDEGENGLIQFIGQNVNLSYTTLIMDQAPFSPPGFGNFGTDTNSDWDPSVALTATSAFSSEPNVFFASPSVAYSESDPVGTNDVIIRAIFLNNSNSNVTAQAFFGQAAFGNGAGNVEWSGVFTNPVTGLPLTNYLILNNDYLLGASTNLNLSSGYPNNFLFSTDPASLAGLPPATVALPTYPAGVLTNVYSYANVQVVPTSVSPGVTSQNPSGALTNLPARFQISASRELSLALANVTGQNYLSLTCTNQFDGSVGATIISPYSDINLGVTNGFLTVSNLLQSIIPAWSGTIQAWARCF